MQDIDASAWKVLVVEDDASNRHIITHVLRFYDAEVVEAASGREALAALDTTSVFTLGLFDIQMADMSGWEVLTELRKRPQPSISQMPVIAVTALAMQGDRERILAAGFDGYIAKPIEVDTFISQIIEILTAYTEKRTV
jgi:CheY-like chemotaxis protein